jgi:hypothetical protein
MTTTAVLAPEYEYVPLAVEGSTSVAVDTAVKANAAAAVAVSTVVAVDVAANPNAAAAVARPTIVAVDDAL